MQVQTKVTITAHCSYCTRKFTPRIHQDSPVADDQNGTLCCDDCYCHDCGGGHYTESEANTCHYIAEQGDPTDEFDEFSYLGDPDAAYDGLHDQMMDLELTP